MKNEIIDTDLNKIKQHGVRMRAKQQGYQTRYR